MTYRCDGVDRGDLNGQGGLARLGTVVTSVVGARSVEVTGVVVGGGGNAGEEAKGDGSGLHFGGFKS